MPLPAALAAKLRKRGIIRNDEEEVIAESYDDDGEGTIRLSRPRIAAPAPGCPNKHNPYHVCSDFCHDRWGDGLPESRVELRYTKRRLRMLRKYPLPPGWKEVYDSGMGRHYYWRMETDEVCWLSPAHPRAVIGEAAPRLARAAFEKINKEKHTQLLKATAMPPGGKDWKPPRRRARSPKDSDTDSDEEMSIARIGKRLRKRNDLDPMDPSAYGECQRGKWADGLNLDDEAKTGVDTTASGPLYQMRPYPSPGAILRARAGKK